MKKERIDQRISPHAAGTQIAVSASLNLQNKLEENIIIATLVVFALIGMCHLSLLPSLQQIFPTLWLTLGSFIISSIFIVAAAVMMGIILVRCFNR